MKSALSVFALFEKQINQKDSLLIPGIYNKYFKNASLTFSNSIQSGSNNSIPTILWIENCYEVDCPQLAFFTNSLSSCFECYTSGVILWGGLNSVAPSWPGPGGSNGSGNGPLEKSKYDDLNSGDYNNNLEGFNDTTTYTPYQIGDPWDTVSHVIDIDDFVGWGASGIERNCMSYAKEQIAKNGYEISNYNSPGQTIQIYTTTGGADSTRVKNGIGYLKSALNRGIPVIVGIDDDTTKSSNPNTDASTDHFVVIVGMGTDTTGNYFTFYDNASGYSSQGAHANNRLYFNTTTWLISGTSQTSYATGLTYIVTMIRKSK